MAVHPILLSSSLSSSFQEIWLPSGARVPFFQSREEVQVHPLSRGARSFSFAFQQKFFAEAVNQHGVWKILAPLEQSWRTVHMEWAEQGQLNLPLKAPLHSLQDEAQRRLLWFVGPESVYPLHMDCGIFFADRVGHGNPISQVSVSFQGEQFHVEARTGGMRSDLQMLTIRRQKTGEISSNHVSTGGLRILKFQTFPGISPFVFLVALMGLSLKYPAMSGKLF